LETIRIEDEYVGAIHAIDLDGDGQTEVFRWGESSLDLFSVTATGDFVFQRGLGSGSRKGDRSISSGDVDGDGDPDLLIASPHDDLLQWVETVNGNLDKTRDLADRVFGPAELVDLNSDARAELVTPHFVYRFVGGEFQRERTNFGAEDTMGFFDLDGDGLLDRFTSWLGGGLSWEPQVQPYRFNRQAGAQLHASGGPIVGADFDGDGDLDLFQVSDGARYFEQVLVGDVNSDGVFNSSDLQILFAAGLYEDDKPNNTTWLEGDFNNDGDFTSADLVMALQASTYVT
jgi:hypothetical protein